MNQAKYEARALGLRERKKRRTRELIAATALELFIERGFEHVTVAEVARAADVAEQTIFNYFPTKEDLVYWRLTGFEEGLLTAVRQRGENESVLSAFRGFVLGQQGLLGDEDEVAQKRLIAISRMIAESPSLIARERRIFDGYTVALGSLIAEGQDSGSQLQAWVVANSLVGVHRAIVSFVRAQMLSGVRGPDLRTEVLAHANRAFAMLERGLEEFGTRAAGLATSEMESSAAHQ